MFVCLRKRNKGRNNSVDTAIASSTLFPAAFTFLISILLSSFPGNVPAAVVTLQSIHLYTTHDLIGKPTVYFRCKGENKTVLPDVTKAKVDFTFQGEESWQPLTEFSSKKCKRCGLYEEDKFLWKHADVFDEWELCPSNFNSSDALYNLVKAKQFNATFSCPECVDLGADPHVAPPASEKKGLSVGVVILISASVTVIVIVGVIGGYKFWRKRKRQQEQLRFMKLFEEQDDLDDELGLGDDL
ncbi:uncharacterized protein LOC141599460 [Silene latifolia]|uniref:uncharacterized protein LOC141599460 n=1 Tax=Silene latifolia TaxID=37657 RepID=UPI003D76C89E